MNRNCPAIREGDLYEVLYVDGGAFEIRYGYYEDFERDNSEPIPVYPDLERTPIYGISGKRIVTHMQEPCPYFEPQISAEAERCCGNCRYYPQNRQMIDTCFCKENAVVTQFERSETE